MKVWIKMVLITGLAIKTNAQVLENVFKGNFIEDISRVIGGLDQKPFIKRGLKLGVKPQTGNLFINSFEAKKARIDLNEFFDDFDFGLNLFINEKIGRNLNLKAIYCLGFLKFSGSDSSKVSGYSLKISLNYQF